MKLIMENWRQWILTNEQNKDIVDAIDAMFSTDSLDDANFKKRAFDLAPDIIEASKVSGLPPGLLLAILKKESSMGVPPAGSKFIRSVKKGPMQLTQKARDQRNKMRDLALTKEKEHWAWDYTSHEELPKAHEGGETTRDNIVAGAMHLRQFLNNRNGNLRLALEDYNGEKTKAQYAEEVLRDYKKTLPSLDPHQAF